MKFGRNFHRYQVPEWEPFYISYNQLKKLFSIAANKASRVGMQPDFTELYAHLKDGIDTLNTFHNSKYEVLLLRKTELCKQYGIPTPLSVIPDLEEVDYIELKVLLEAFIELRKDLKKLQWYNRVNQDAIERIYAKLEKFNKSIGRSHHDHRSKWFKSQLACETQCLKDVERLNKLVADISSACTYAQSGSARKSLYLKYICDKYSPFPIYPSSLHRAVRDDQVPTLAKLLEEETLNTGAPDSRHFQAFLYGLLQFSMTCQSRRCTPFLLLEALPKNGAVIDHDCLNHLITIIGRSNSPADPADLETGAQGVSDQSDSETGTSLFLQMFNQLRPSQKGVLQAVDVLGRLPLHYSALYGLTAICQSILNSLLNWEQDFSAAGEAVLLVDSEGCTPLHYAVVRNHDAVVRLFMDTLEMNYQTADKASDQHLRSVLGSLLIIALRSQYDDIIHLLITSPVDINYRSSRGETALYVAAQIGRGDYVEILLKAVSAQNAQVDIPETVYGWTPLFIGCAEGHLAVVELLLQAGASQTILDHRGWTAKEHATFRGHLAVAETLNKCKTGDLTGGPANTPFKAAVGANCHIQTGHSHIIANLGVMQKEKQVTAVDLDCFSSKHVQDLNRDTRFSIEVSAPGGSESNRLLRLPILHDMINDPFVFPIKNPSGAQLTFKIFCATPAERKKGILVGSGTALLESNTHCFGANRESLIRERTVPILEKETLNVMGTVTFSYVIARPFMHFNTPSSINDPIKGADPVQLVGHRGLGQNVASHEYLQLGENTIESFLSAAKLGASFVEFDVQLTRDLVPVIYHDFSLSESGTDVPIHDLSLKQFMYASKVQSPRGDPVSVLGRANLHPTRAEADRGKPRSRSLTKEREGGAKEVRDRMKHTVDFLNKGFKPNTRGDFIQDSFATLEELLVELPKSISFDIEIKYPRRHEAVDAGVAPVAIELNTFIDIALDKIYRFGTDRTIILSSFTPEVCILLATKQQTYPVMFITNAGKLPMADAEVRASSLQVAVRFARHWNLSGVVFASEPLILCPRFISYVKNSGLSCASYGLLNNIPENVKLQVEAGLDMIMADRVGLISETLKSISV